MNCMRLLRSICHQQRRYIFHISTARYATQHPIKFLETQDKWKEKDGMSRRWELIYKAPMDYWLNYMTTYLTLSTAIVGCGGIYYAAFSFDPAIMNEPVTLGEDIVIANSSIECLVYVGAFVAFHTAVKILLSKYVLRMYQDGDKYVAIFRGHFFNTITKYEFHVKDFKKLNPTFVVSWGDARYGLGNKHAIILDNYFKTPNHLNYLLYKKSSYNPNNEDD